MPVFSRLICTVSVAALLLATPAMAQTATTPAAPAEPPVTIWRNDAAIIDAEKLIAERKFVDALTYLDQIILRNMRNIDAHVHTALAWFYLGNMDKAKSSLKSAQIIDSNHIGSYVIAGMIALKEKKYADAADYLNVIRMLCRGETCVEYQTLQRLIRETPEEREERWYHF